MNQLKFRRIAFHKNTKENGLNSKQNMPNSLHTYKQNLNKMSQHYPSHSTRSLSHQEIRNKLFSRYFFTDENYKNISYITTMVEIISFPHYGQLYYYPHYFSLQFFTNINLTSNYHTLTNTKFCLKHRPLSDVDKKNNFFQ